MFKKLQILLKCNLSVYLHVLCVKNNPSLKINVLFRLINFIVWVAPMIGACDMFFTILFISILAINNKCNATKGMSKNIILKNGDSWQYFLTCKMDWNVTMLLLFTMASLNMFILPYLIIITLPCNSMQNILFQNNHLPNSLLGHICILQRCFLFFYYYYCYYLYSFSTQVCLIRNKIYVVVVVVISYK